MKFGWGEQKVYEAGKGKRDNYFWLSLS